MIYQECSIPELPENALPSCSGIALDQALPFLSLTDIAYGHTASEMFTAFAMYVGFFISE